MVDAVCARETNKGNAAKKHNYGLLFVNVSQVEVNCRCTLCVNLQVVCSFNRLSDYVCALYLKQLHFIADYFCSLCSLGNILGS